MSFRLAVLTSHPIQYQAPLFRRLSESSDLTVFFARRASSADQAHAGFGTMFEWDVDLVSGYRHVFMTNVAKQPGLDHFAGCDTPEISQRLTDGKFDALLVMGWHLKSYLQGIWAAKRLGIPVMVRGDSHLDTPRSSLKQISKSIGYPVFLRLFDAALYVGQRSRAYYRHYHFPERRLFHSPHCIDAERFRAHATEDARGALLHSLAIGRQTKVILFAGKLLPFKRPLDVIEAVAECRQRGGDIDVVVAGDGELRETMLRHAENLRVPTHFLGFCNQSKMPAVYAASDALVLPSDGRETWGLVANEALACGKPIILSDTCGSAPDLAVDGNVGRAFPVGDIAALTAAISDVLTKPPSRAAISTMSERHSLSAAADGVMAALSFVVRRRGREEYFAT